MLGFDARSDGGTRSARDGELGEVALVSAWRRSGPRWTGRVRTLLLPPSISIARYLIERWVARHDGEPAGAM